MKWKKIRLEEVLRRREMDEMRLVINMNKLKNEVEELKDKLDEIERKSIGIKPEVAKKLPSGNLERHWRR